MEVLFALLIVTVIFFTVCSVSIHARRIFLLYREREIAERTADGVLMRLEAKQPIPEFLNGFEISVEGSKVHLRNQEREYEFEVEK
jgi:hypothetical protein